MKLRVLVGAGDRVMGFTVPFIVAGVAADILWPSVFRMGLGATGLVIGLVLLVIGVPFWLTSVAQVLVFVPKRRLITTGPFALMLHPLYTSVALLVFPGIGFVVDTWLGIALGAVLYVSTRIFSRAEEKILAGIFPAEYPAYRAKVLLPWL
jgi:protein-S-isoprenylcysteine O-methyltransferase Ste14